MAIEAMKERETLNELASKYEVSPVMISRWKKELIENSADHVTVGLILVKDLDKCGKQGKHPDWYLGQPLVLAAHSEMAVAYMSM